MNTNDLIDNAVAAVRDEPIDPKGLEAARDRVRARLTADLADGIPEATPEVASATPRSHQIAGCDGFRALLPAYLAGALAEPKRVLVEDHTRECVACRRALQTLKRGEGARPQTVVPRRGRRLPGRMLLAAGLAGLAVVSGTLMFRAGVFAPTPTAVVSTIDGELAIVESSGTRPALAGESFGGDRSIRTGGDSGAVVTLADGSKVELAERSELALGKRWDGTVLKLARGSVIVEAAEQRRGHLYVETADCQVAVVGTIFSVNAGSKGSRVSVVEGEVRVKQGAERAVLRPGDQFATGRLLGAVPVDQEIAWSRNAAEYRERLAALQSLGRELDRTFVSAGARTSTRLLDLAPADTAVFVAVPNLSQSLAQAWELVQQRAAENPALADWWSESFPAEASAEIDEAIAELSRFGAELGPELAVAVALRPGDGDAEEHDARPVLFAEVLDPTRFAPLLDEEIARLNARAAEEGHAPHLRRITDPTGASANGDELLVWLAGDLLVASPAVEKIVAVDAAIESGSNPFIGGAFHARLARVYGEGTDWLLGVDLGSVISGETAPGGEAADEAVVLDRLGFSEIEHLVIDRRDGNGASGPDGAGENRALLSFGAERRGLASWLAAPAPLGALDFVSPAAHVAVAGLLKEPVEMMDDLLALAVASEDGESNETLAKLAEIEQELGISFRADVAGALGGDFAFAFDGPWLPTPSWKLVLEVADAARLHATVQSLVEAWNREVSGTEGESSTPRPAIRLSQESVDGRVMFTLSAVTAGAAPIEIAHGLFTDGYLLLGPSRALLLESVTQRDAGVRLSSSQAFLDLVPRDGRAHVSGLVYQNVAGSLGSLAELIRGRLPEGEAADDAVVGDLADMAAEAGPGLAVAYAEGREISFVTRGLRGPLGMSFESLLSLGAIFHRVAPDGAGAEPEPGAAPEASASVVEPAVEPRAETRIRSAA
jgi:ferric-dicitrate binding protein FerR (iron transport regulator)